MQSIRRTESGIQVNIFALLYEQDGCFVCSSPFLDLAGHGESEDAAISSFKFILEEFIQYSLDRQILQKNLEKLGWNLEDGEICGELDGIGFSRSDSAPPLSEFPVTGGKFFSFKDEILESTAA